MSDQFKNEERKNLLLIAVAHVDDKKYGCDKIDMSKLARE